MDRIYANSDAECDIAISFNPREDGAQDNPCRSLVVEYLRNPTLTNGRKLAKRLESVTTHRSGLGLLFLISGRVGNERKIVISRFPADTGILADEGSDTLSVKYLERVFMKNSFAYKAAAYQDRSLTAGFWIGEATDKQASDEIQISNYWIGEFLDSDFRTTAAHGTRRLAVALREAARNNRDVQIRSEIAAAATLAKGLSGRQTSIREFGRQLNLSPSTVEAIESSIENPSVASERFRFDMSEFANQLPYRTIELDTGGLLTAPSGNFDDIFDREVIDRRSRRERITTEGNIIDEQIGKARGKVGGKKRKED